VIFFVLILLALLGWLSLVMVGLFAIVGFQDGVFWVVSTAMISAAVGVVLAKDIFKAALCLVATFLLMAGLFVLLSAEFLAVVQVLVYVGAVSILIVFSVLLTRSMAEKRPSIPLQVVAATLSTLLMLLIIIAVSSTDWVVIGPDLGDTRLGLIEEVLGDTPQFISGMLLNKWVVPFEAASVLLLAAILGALVLIREQRDES
jgi:NADH-quinone oxidoreductase subunit J